MELLTPQKLIETLQTLPPGVTLHKNLIGNLVVRSIGGRDLGFVDLRTGGVEMWGQSGGIRAASRTRETQMFPRPKPRVS